MSVYLGVDGGGTNTDFLLIDAAGRVLARHREGCAYYPEVGLDGLRAMLDRGIGRTLANAGVGADTVRFAFFGIPAYGEDSRLQSTLDAAPGGRLPAERYRCGNDVVCGWAGALAGSDGIHLVAGTGSIGYGEYGGRAARAGGWGELFGDEGSAFWIVREALQAFARSADGRDPRGALYTLLRGHFGLGEDLDICGAIYGTGQPDRSRVAALAPLVAEAAGRGDPAAMRIFAAAVTEFVEIVEAVRTGLGVPDDVRMPVSYSGGMFRFETLIRTPLAARLDGDQRYEFRAPLLTPDAGAAVHAARLAGEPLPPEAIDALRRGRIAR
ncbi:MAG: N-acetylglucosamine kinase [Gammaproteobacteria bacterium]|nr:N-acetylglucosamine kinase [Gammaproteobacteria bacterium]